MNTQQAAVKLSFDKASNNLLSVKLRISFQRERKRYALPLKEPVLLSEQDFERLINYHETRNKRTAEEIRLLYARIQPFIEKAENICETLIPFSFDKFRDAFYSEKEEVDTEENDVIAALRQKAVTMKAAERIGNADNYEAAAQSLNRFVEGMGEKELHDLLGIAPPRKGQAPKPAVLRFEHITPLLLTKYEQWMLRFGKAPRKKNTLPTPASLTTVGVYLRHLRAVYNDAIEAKVVPQEAYPFSRKGFVIPAGRNVKKALTKEDVRKIMAYECVNGDMEQRGKDLWVLSYLSNGMNLTDICNLRWSSVNVQEKTITFVRNKTSRSQKGNQIRIVAHLFPESLAILERWGTKERLPNSFVFPFLTDDMDAERKKEKIRQVIKMTNKWMNRIAEALNIQQDVNTYNARHSFATILLKSGAAPTFIGQKLGHSSLRSTESYLGSFDDEETKDILNSLL